MILWLKLLICLVVIAYAGYNLSRYGDIIAEKTGMSGSWVGLILLATATSLPELVTGVSSVTVADAPDIAVGNALGSTVFNLAILIILDALYKRETLYSSAAQGHILSAALGGLMIGFAGFSLLLDSAGMSPVFGHVGLYTPFFVLIYFVAVRAVHKYEQRLHDAYTEASVERYPEVTLKKAISGFSLAAAAVVATGIWLPFVAKDIAELMGWGESFVGTLLVAAVTSAPEVVVTVSALRIGALDMAIANVLGSNLFNIIYLAVDDLFYTQGSVLASVNSAHAITAFTSVMMSALVIVGFIYRPQQRAILKLTWISLGLFVLYILNTWVQFQYGQ
ncbi:MAG TPA: sodium:calcium antiporter [Methylotenera sp.]|nr:sodium:calcium antiporter [Methylotenera sp.]